MSRHLQAVEARFGKYWIEGGATEEQVRLLESTLGRRLPAGYRLFLLSAGAMAGRPDSYISGIIEGDPLCLNGGSLYGETLRGREEFGLPESLIIVQWDDEAPYCLDLSAPNEDGESPVVCYESCSGAQGVVAKDFDDWFDRFFLA